MILAAAFTIVLSLPGIALTWALLRPIRYASDLPVEPEQGSPAFGHDWAGLVDY